MSLDREEFVLHKMVQTCELHAAAPTCKNSYVVTYNAIDIILCSFALRWYLSTCPHGKHDTILYYVRIKIIRPTGRPITIIVLYVAIIMNHMNVC